MWLGPKGIRLKSLTWKDPVGLVSFGWSEVHIKVGGEIRTPLREAPDSGDTDPKRSWGQGVEVETGTVGLNTFRDESE